MVALHHLAGGGTLARTRLVITLAIETSTTRGSIALARDGEVLLERSFASERSHNSQIFTPLGEALELATPELIAVGTGPGSYTGARIGIAAGIGISLTHDARLIGIPSVTLAESEGAAERYHLVGDARRGHFFYAEVEHRRLVREPELIDREELTARLGDDRHLITFDPSPPAPGITVTRPSATILASVAEQLGEAEIEALASAPVVPHYMSAPFVTMPKKGRS